MGRGDIVTATEGINSLEVESGDGLADSTLDGIRQVGTNLCSGLDSYKALFKELIGCEIVLTTFCSLLICDIGGIALVFLLNGGTVEHTA